MKRIVFFIILVISIFIINNLVHSIYTLWKKQDLIVQARKNVELEKKKNQELQKKLEIVLKDEFVEEEARNKLFMVKQGEQTVILPKISNSIILEVKKQEAVPNWKKWLELFF